MEDENAKEDTNDPSTSKKESQSNNSYDDVYDNRGDRVTNRDMSDSDSYSVRSGLDMAGPAPAIPVGSIMKDNKSNVKKKRTKRLEGRVKKRERPPAKRPRKVAKRKPKGKEQKKERDLSVSTIFTRLSSSGYRTPDCEHCGHRCCRRRYEYEMRKKYSQNNRKKIRKSNRKVKKKRVYNRRKENLRISEGYQVGSRSNMLSPLFISTNSAADANQLQSAMYCEITPEIIYDALRRLTMWKQDVPTNTILEYIIRHYPVNSDRGELMIDLFEKLTVATIVGIISRTSNDTWGLSHVFQKRKLGRNHVTLFWKTYADTLRPVAKKDINRIQKQVEKKTSRKLNSILIYNEEYI